MRNLSCCETARLVSEPRLGGLPLEALGLEHIRYFATASDQYNGSIEIPHIGHQNDGGRMACVYGGVYHSNRGDDDDQSEKYEEWPDPGEDSDEDPEKMLEHSLEEASQNGSSNDAKINLEHIIRKFRDVIRLRLSC